MADYSKLTNDEFQDILVEILQDEGVSQVITIHGIYEILAEHYNNEVLARWEKAHPMEAWGEDPDYPVEDWQGEVANDETRLGYADWVKQQKELDGTSR